MDTELVALREAVSQLAGDVANLVVQRNLAQAQTRKLAQQLADSEKVANALSEELAVFKAASQLAKPSSD